jgi:hypothetical protein
VLGSTYFCPNNNVLDKRIKTNCVLGLNNRNQEVITANCPWISIAATNFTVQLGANKFLLYLANSKEVQLVCRKESATRSLHGLKQLTVPAVCKLFTESYVMEGQRHFSQSVNTYLERLVNVEELFNFSRLHVDDMAGILQDLDLVGSTTGLTIKNNKDRYADYSVQGTFVRVTRWVVVGLSILGLRGIFWCFLKRYKKAKKDHRPLLKRFRYLLSADNPPRDQEMQERGNTDSDENEDFIPGMIPDDMQQGPIAHAPVNMGHVARRARDELRVEARVRDHQATVHRDQKAASSVGATGGAMSRH